LSRFFFDLFGFASRSRLTVPPAASIFSRALDDIACTVTVSAFVSSPVPRIFTSLRVVRIRPRSFSSSGVTSVPASKTSRRPTFTGCWKVRNGPIGIASLDVEPRCLPMRMYDGICPPSKPARILCEPARDFWPLSPRPE
jgi:hypothetical protein